MPKSTIPVGHSARTPLKHFILNVLLGREAGAFISAPDKIPARADPWLIVDLCAGDGVNVPGDHESSHSVIHRHADFARSKGVNVHTVFIEKNEATLKTLVTEAWHRGDEVSDFLHADARDYVVRPRFRDQAIFINADPNSMADLPLTDTFLGSLTPTTSMVVTMGCNVGGLKRIPLSERGSWFDFIEIFTDTLPDFHDALLVTLNSDAAQWAYLMRVPARWSGKTMVEAMRAVKKHWPPGAEIISIKNDRRGFERLATRLFKTKAELKTHKPIVITDIADNNTLIVTVDGRVQEIERPKVVRFNRTNENVDWALWTWNPVTGCNHGCRFCYARAIANMDRMAPSYPFQFEPSFHPYRLAAPRTMPAPKPHADPRAGRVFVCSMADLFGKWVPDEWIKAVFDVCRENPAWEYLFLTKWPARYRITPLLPRAWYGASIIQQADVARVTKAMAALEGQDIVRWLSLEPLLSPLELGDLSWCDLIVIGGQTATRQPDGYVAGIAPKYDWIHDIVMQAREFGVPYYLKPNIGLDAPGMDLPKMRPRNRPELSVE